LLSEKGGGGGDGGGDLKELTALDGHENLHEETGQSGIGKQHDFIIRAALGEGGGEFSDVWKRWRRGNRERRSGLARRRMKAQNQGVDFGGKQASHDED
jgi:hypothetical protein